MAAPRTVEGDGLHRINNALADTELRLLIAACGRPATPTLQSTIDACLAAPIRWPHLTALAARHRVAGLVHDTLFRAGVDPAVLADSGLTTLTQRGTLLALQLAREAVRLQAAFNSAGLAAIVVKGAPLGTLAYGNVGIKHCWDIDLLVQAHAVAAARRLLLELGYAMTEPAGLEDAQFERFCAFSKEAIFINAFGLAVELHWRLVDPPEMLAEADPFADCRTVAIAGGEVCTLGDRIHLAYLACHGQRHGWSRLKWIADVHGLIARQPPSTTATMIEGAARHGAGRSVAAALWLCHDLFALDVDAELLRDWRKRATMRMIRATNHRCIAAPLGGSELPIYSRTNLAILATVLAAAPTWRVRWGFFKTIWNRPVERALRPPESLARYSVRRFIQVMVGLPARVARDRALSRKAKAGPRQNQE